MMPDERRCLAGGRGLLDCSLASSVGGQLAHTEEWTERGLSVGREVGGKAGDGGQGVRASNDGETGSAGAQVSGRVVVRHTHTSSETEKCRVGGYRSPAGSARARRRSKAVVSKLGRLESDRAPLGGQVICLRVRAMRYTSLVSIRAGVEASGWAGERGSDGRGGQLGRSARSGGAISELREFVRGAAGDESKCGEGDHREQSPPRPSLPSIHDPCMQNEHSPHVRNTTPPPSTPLATPLPSAFRVTPSRRDDPPPSHGRQDGQPATKKVRLDSSLVSTPRHSFLPVSRLDESSYDQAPERGLDSTAPATPSVKQDINKVRSFTLIRKVPRSRQMQYVECDACGQLKPAARLAQHQRSSDCDEQRQLRQRWNARSSVPSTPTVPRDPPAASSSHTPLPPSSPCQGFLYPLPFFLRYPHVLEEDLNHRPWTVSSVSPEDGGQAVLRHTSCRGKREGGDRTMCIMCARIEPNKAFAGLLRNAQLDAVPANAPMTPAQTATRMALLARTIIARDTEVSTLLVARLGLAQSDLASPRSQIRRLFNRISTFESLIRTHGDILQLLATSDFFPAFLLLRLALAKQSGPATILKRLKTAIANRLLGNPVGGSYESSMIDIGVIILTLGGPKLVETLHRVFNTPTIGPIRKFMASESFIIPSAYPKLEEEIHNFMLSFRLSNIPVSVRPAPSPPPFNHIRLSSASIPSSPASVHTDLAPFSSPSPVTGSLPPSSPPYDLSALPTSPSASDTRLLPPAARLDAASSSTVSELGRLDPRLYRGYSVCQDETAAEPVFVRHRGTDEVGNACCEHAGKVDRHLRDGDDVLRLSTLR